MSFGCRSIFIKRCLELLACLTVFLNFRRFVSASADRLLSLWDSVDGRNIDNVVSNYVHLQITPYVKFLSQIFLNNYLVECVLSFIWLVFQSISKKFSNYETRLLVFLKFNSNCFKRSKSGLNKMGRSFLFCTGEYSEIVVIDPQDLNVIFTLSSRVEPDWISAIGFIRPTDSNGKCSCR